MAGFSKATGHGKTYNQTNFATRTLLFLQIDMGTDVATNYNTNDSLYQKAVIGLQQLGELYGLGIPSGNWFTAIVSADTFPLDGQAVASGDRLSTIEATINASTGATCAVWNGRLRGSSIENDC